MFNKQTHNDPPEVVTSLHDLMEYEYLVQSHQLLPDHPVYSILAGRHASKLRGRGLDFEEVRQYVAGDDIRNIDWRVTARVGKTHSKVFTEEKERPFFLILDQGSSMFFGSQRFVKSVTAAHAAALSAFYTIKRGDRFGGIIYNEDGFDYIVPKRSKKLVQHFLQCVVNRNETLPSRTAIKPGTSLLNDMLRRAQSLVTHDYVVAVISDFSSIDDETRKHLRSISYHNDVMLVHIEDKLDDALPDGRLVLSDGRRQIAWQNTRHNWGQKYTTAYRNWKAEFVNEFRRYRIPVLFFNTTDTVEDQVMRGMGRLFKNK